ncbi:hypothetical protein HFD88_004130 [Aspergillus terreus]|nr:hypothetical protein HFD88_004130 [Aspergillus terreus]
MLASRIYMITFGAVTSTKEQPVGHAPRTQFARNLVKPLERPEFMSGMTSQNTPTFFKAILAIPTASDSTEAQASNNSSDTLNSCQPSYKLLGEAQDRTVGTRFRLYLIQQLGFRGCYRQSRDGPCRTICVLHPSLNSIIDPSRRVTQGQTQGPPQSAGKMGRVQEDENHQGYLKLSKKDVSSEYVDIVTDSRNSEYGVPILAHSKELWNMPLGMEAYSLSTCAEDPAKSTASLFYYIAWLGNGTFPADTALMLRAYRRRRGLPVHLE